MKKDILGQILTVISFADELNQFKKSWSLVIILKERFSEHVSVITIDITIDYIIQSFQYL